MRFITIRRVLLFLFPKQKAYSDFIKVGKIDPKIDVLSEVNDCFRAFLASALEEFEENSSIRHEVCDLRSNEALYFVKIGSTGNFSEATDQAAGEK